MGKLINKLKKKISLKIYNEIRQQCLKEYICNIGKIVEEEDKIICYVNQKYVDRYKGNKTLYKLRLNGINQITEGIKETVEKLKLNKPVYYIFDGIEFSPGLQITSLWAHVIFRNCTFDKNIGIIYGNEITFVNDNFFNSYDLKMYGDQHFGMQIDAKEVEFINTKVEAEYPATINITAESTRIEKSELKAHEVYIDSQNIDFVDSSLVAQNGAIIENALLIF